MSKNKISAKLDYLPPMPKDKSVGIGCVGSGFIMADCHLVSYREAGFNPVAITSRKLENAEAVAEQHNIPKAYGNLKDMLKDEGVQVVDVAVPPDVQFEIIEEILEHKHIKGILAQKPLGVNFPQARKIVEMCDAAGVTLAVNQNMRYDQSIRGCKSVLERGYLGEPVFAQVDMHAIPHWMPWQERQGWVTLRVMSIHHLDTFRYLFGDPDRVICSVRPDPRTIKKFNHQDGIVIYILEYDSGFRALGCDDVWTGPAQEGAREDIGINWRVSGTEGMAKGTIGWPKYPERQPSTIDFTTTDSGIWHKPRWKKVWFPDAFSGPMADLLIALENNTEPTISGRDNLMTMALVDACYRSAEEHRAVSPLEIFKGSPPKPTNGDNGKAHNDDWADENLKDLKKRLKRLKKVVKEKKQDKKFKK